MFTPTPIIKGTYPTNFKRQQMGKTFLGKFSEMGQGSSLLHLENLLKARNKTQ